MDFGDNESLSENDTEEINNEVQQPNGEGEHINSILLCDFSSWKYIFQTTYNIGASRSYLELTLPSPGNEPWNLNPTLLAAINNNRLKSFLNKFAYVCARHILLNGITTKICIQNLPSWLFQSTHNLKVVT